MGRRVRRMERGRRRDPRLVARVIRIVTRDFDPNQPRAEDGKWTSTGAGSDPSNTLKDPHEPGIAPEEKVLRLTRQDEHEWKKKLEDPTLAPKDRPMPERLFVEKLKEYEGKLADAKDLHLSDSQQRSLAGIAEDRERHRGVRDLDIENERVKMEDKLVALGLSKADAQWASESVVQFDTLGSGKTPVQAISDLLEGPGYEAVDRNDAMNALHDLRGAIAGPIQEFERANRELLRQEGDIRHSHEEQVAQAIDRVDAEMGIEFHYA